MADAYNQSVKSAIIFLCTRVRLVKHAARKELCTIQFNCGNTGWDIEPLRSGCQRAGSEES